MLVPAAISSVVVLAGTKLLSGYTPVVCSSLSVLYALILKTFFVAWKDFDDSVGTTLLDLLPPIACLLSCVYGPKLLSDTMGAGVGDLVPVLVQVVSALSLCFARSLYLKQVVGKRFKDVNLDGRVYLVTGSNTGLGYETAKELVRLGGVVVMACRSLDKANTARDAILEETKCRADQLIVLPVPLDLNSFKSVELFSEEFLRREQPLHCLVNNAGVMMSERNVTDDGLEMVITANHLSSFLLTSLIIPALDAGAKKWKVYSRIVNVSSSLHQIPKAFNFDDIMSQKHYELFATYGMSKLANILFTIELQKRLTKASSCITANCLHPGFVRTEVTRNMNAFLFWGDKLATPIMLTLQKTPSQGAYCTVHVAISPDIEKKGGLYFSNCQIAKPGRGATSDDAARLWHISTSLTRANYEI